MPVVDRVEKPGDPEVDAGGSELHLRTVTVVREGGSRSRSVDKASSPVPERQLALS